MPMTALLLSAAEIASTMGDHQAITATADLKKEMEILLAEKRAEAAERVEPARARVERAKIGADAAVAERLEGSSDVLKTAKRIRAELAAETVISPLIRGGGQIVEAGAEVVPALFKGYAQFWDRWLKQRGVDPKLVGTTSGGLAVGIVGGAVVAFVMTPLAGLVVLAAVPTAAAAGYMAVKGFRTASEEG